MHFGKYAPVNVLHKLDWKIIYFRQKKNTKFTNLAQRNRHVSNMQPYVYTFILIVYENTPIQQEKSTRV